MIFPNYCSAAAINTFAPILNRMFLRNFIYLINIF